MKKKFAVIVVTIVCAFVCAMGLTACGGSGGTSGGTNETGGHKHVWSQEWQSDDMHHWHDCTADGCPITDNAKKNGYAVHNTSGTNGACSVCGYKEVPEHKHIWSKTWQKDNTHHWHDCTATGCAITDNMQKDSYGAHDTLGANGVCSVCGYKDGLLTFKLLQLGENDTVYGKVSNATETFSFLTEVTANGGATYTVSVDIGGTQIIPTKTVSLDIGDNTFYILAQRDDEITFFTVTIRRRPIHTVMYDTDGGTACDSEQVEEDDWAVAPTTSKKGYTFAKWDYDFINPIVADTTITAIWNANNYTVTFDANGGETPIRTQSVTYDRAYTFPSPKRMGYTFTGWYSDETQIADNAIWQYAEDKSIVAHWQINTYTLNITYDKNAGSVSGTTKGTYNYHTEIIETVTSYFGYNFIGWYDGETKLSEEESYSFMLPDKDINIVAKWEVNNEMDNFTFSSTAETCTITGVQNKTVSKITIPDYVTSIGYNAFYNCNSLAEIRYMGDIASWCNIGGLGNLMSYGKSDRKLYIGGKEIAGKLVIPDSVTSIGYNAFCSCSSLTSITIPNSVTSIGSGAFSGCSNLTSITIPFVGTSKDGTSNTRFKDIFGAIPSSLKTVIITGGESIGNYAFYGCDSLTSITIPQSVTSIGEEAFCNCSALESITIPFVGASKGGTSNTHFGYIFGASSYSYNSSRVPSSLKTVVITSGENIGSSAFSYCSSLTSIEIPNSVTSIGIPNSVTSIGSGAFSNCSSITSITIPDGVTSIGGSAFYNCSSLTSITIPNSVTSIGYYAFYGCSNLTSITIPFVGASKGGTDNTHFGYIFGAKSSYHSDSSHTQNSNRVPSSLKTVIITGGTRIKNSAFQNCSSITSITIGDSVTSIDSGAFSSCSSITSITIGNSVMYISMHAFYNCSSLTSITIPDSVISIGDDAFFGCSRLQYNEYNNAYYLGNSTNPYVVLKKVKDTSITSCTIHANTKVIYYGAFSSCSSLTSITIPNGVTSIEGRAFQYCSSLTSITFKGTKTQWNKITKNSYWNYNTGKYTVHCTDGDIAKS